MVQVAFDRTKRASRAVVASEGPGLRRGDSRGLSSGYRDPSETTESAQRNGVVTVALSDAG